ncbi:MAG TPA: universal stress protein [Candidatus Deferrimicrobiaceae bacterium]|nr:universal stress protein [Candidatus Deferrimicrobiaceae bacterium]
MAARMGFRRVVLGMDGSAHSRRAAAFLQRLQPPRGGRVTVVRVVEPVRVPSMPLVPGAMRAQIAGQAAAANRNLVAAARRQVEATAAALAQAGWRARAVVRTGVPLAELLAAVRAERADVLVLGARGAGAVTHFLLGSVAEAALKHAPVEVLIVK